MRWRSFHSPCGGRQSRRDLSVKVSGERAESRKAPEALQERAVCSAGKVQGKRLWRESGRKSMRKNGSGARRLGRGCEVPVRDLLGLPTDSDSHLNAWSSRK